MNNRLSVVATVRVGTEAAAGIHMPPTPMPLLDARRRLPLGLGLFIETPLGFTDQANRRSDGLTG